MGYNRGLIASSICCSIFSLPDGTVLMIANNQKIIYDVEKNTEIILPDIPNGVRIKNPFDGTAALLPLSPPNYIPEVLLVFCGGSTLFWPSYFLFLSSRSSNALLMCFTDISSSFRCALPLQPLRFFLVTLSNIPLWVGVSLTKTQILSHQSSYLALTIQ